MEAETQSVEVRNGARKVAAPGPVILPDPLFILSPPRSFTSVVCAMLGQHDQLYGLLETGLFNVATMAEWWQTSRPVGLLRCVAQLFFGEQTEVSVVKAEAWLRRRNSLSTAHVFEEIALRVAPRKAVEKTPAMVFDVDHLRRTHEMFPGGHYLHLLRHPRGYGESVMNHVLRLAAERDEAPPRWLEHLQPLDEAHNGSRPVRRRSRPANRDPQWDWLRLHDNILTFLEDIPADRKLTVRGEELLADPDHHLRVITRWLGLRSDDAVIEAMKHPEDGPYSFLGPPNARFGTSRYFLKEPQLRPDRGRQHSLQGALPWREDGAWLAPPVSRLARAFGYV
jgi:hypothetical protein